MSWLALGDLHGRNIWESIVKSEKADRIIFSGDYFDSHEGLPAQLQLSNFEKLLAFKNSHPRPVILLIGNHDYHYLGYSERRYSGYQANYAREIGDILRWAHDQHYLQVAYRLEKLLFSHAGITRCWAERQQIDFKAPARSINQLFDVNPLCFDFSPGPKRDPSGNEIEQGPLWVRPPSLLSDMLPGYLQVVGHTIQYELRQLNDLFLIDCLGTSGQYLYGDEEAFSIRSLSED